MDEASPKQENGDHHEEREFIYMLKYKDGNESEEQPGSRTDVICDKNLHINQLNNVYNQVVMVMSEINM